MKIRLILVKFFADLKLAIFLFLAIANFSAIGSVIEQNQPIQFYQKNYSNALFGIFNSKLILQIGLDHIFKTWWFITLLVLFGLSLTCCTFLQQLPALNRVRKVRFYSWQTKILKKFSINLNSRFWSVGRYISSLRGKHYIVFQSNKNIYAQKGLIGRVSPIVVHFSMVLVLLGTILASTSGFIAQEFIPETEIFYIQNILNTNLNTSIPKISGRVNDFWISYKKDRSIKQFYTDLSLIDNKGKEIKRETIYVNHPLKYNGLTFYQTDWNVVGFRIKETAKTYQFPVIKNSKNLFLSWIPNDFNKISSLNGFTLLSVANREEVLLYDLSGSLLSKAELNEAINQGYFLGLIETTGIQIKADPGLGLIYFGFFLLIISIFTSYISHSQIWYILENRKAYLKGINNRSKIEFEFEIFNLILKL